LLHVAQLGAFGISLRAIDPEDFVSKQTLATSSDAQSSKTSIRRRDKPQRVMEYTNKSDFIRYIWYHLLQPSATAFHQTQTRCNGIDTKKSRHGDSKNSKRLSKQCTTTHPAAARNPGSWANCPTQQDPLQYAPTRHAKVSGPQEQTYDTSPQAQYTDPLVP
jgi:hypothetical protein